MTEEASQEEFLRQLNPCRPALRRYLFAHVPDYHEAEDSLQKVILVMWRKFNTFRKDGNFQAWAFGIARYEILHARRTSARNRLVFDDTMLDRLESRLQESAPEQDIRLRFLAACVEKLPDRTREIVRWKYDRSMSIQVIAESVHGTVGSVAMLLCRARRLIAECINIQIAKASGGL
jgi:RNA polymerase sigma-70 factor, ECF subfamily